MDEATSYTLDLFLVAGGRIHDYAMNGPRFFEGDSGSYSLEGVSPEARAGVWTLAALGTMDGSEEANAPGKSWGERIGPNDRIQAWPLRTEARCRTDGCRPPETDTRSSTT